MIEIGGVMRPSSYEEATTAADTIENAIALAREKVYTAQRELLKVCADQYPTGSQVYVNIAAGRSTTHDVIAVNEHGYLTLRNPKTGTERQLAADSYSIHPARCWYRKVERKAT